MKPTHYQLAFDTETTITYAAPPEYDGTPLKIDEYEGECNPSFTTIDLRALSILDIGCESIPPCITKVYLKSMPRSADFSDTVKEIYVDHTDEIVWFYSGASIYMDISNYGLLDSYNGRDPQFFFTKDPSAALLTLDHPNYDSSPITFTQEFGIAMAVCSFTRKPRLTHRDALWEDFNTLKQLSRDNALATAEGRSITDPAPSLFPVPALDSTKPKQFNTAMTRIAIVHTMIKIDIKRGMFHNGYYFVARGPDTSPFDDYLPQEDFDYDMCDRLNIIYNPGK